MMSSYSSAEMLEETYRVADDALDRTAQRMARQTMRNMLHLDPNAAASYGGPDNLEARLKDSYQASFEAA